MTTVLIDADLVAFRAAASAEEEHLSVACFRADDMIRRILTHTQADEYHAFLTGENNFRREIDPLYKANRTQPKPRHLQDVKQFLTTDWNAQVADGCEADDYLGIYQQHNTIIASIDKDLKQIPGSHFNFVKEEFFEVSPIEGLRFFYKQTLIGDTSDNIFGIYGIGPKKAAKLIDPLDTEEEMYYTCRKLYKDDVRFHLNCKLLWVLREYNKVWEPSQQCLTYYDQQVQELAQELETSDQRKMASLESTGPGISGSDVSGIKTGATV